MSTGIIPPGILVAQQSDLGRLVGFLREKNYLGFTMTIQGSQFVAACMNRHGQPCDPRNWDPMPSPEAAIADLLKRVEGVPAKKLFVRLIGREAGNVWAEFCWEPLFNTVDRRGPYKDLDQAEEEAIAEGKKRGVELAWNLNRSTNGPKT